MRSTSYAAELERPFPIGWNRETGEYRIPEELREALKQARLWSVPSPYEHRVIVDGQVVAMDSVPVPYRWMLWHRNGDELGKYPDTETMRSEHPEAFDDAEYELWEFRPDHAAGVLVAEERPDEPVIAWRPGV